MLHRLGILAASTALLAACASTPDPQAVLRQADQALGASALKTLRYSGDGTGATFGQAYQPESAWPRLNYSVLTRTIDYDNAALREDYARSRGEPSGGGATPLMGQGEQRVSGLVMGDFAWNAAGNAATPAPVNIDARVHDLWTTPHGAIKAAQRHGATAGTRSEGGQSFSTFSYTVPGRLTATAWVDGNGQIVRIDSRMPNPVLGDTETVTRYSDYRAFDGGVRFPMRIQQSQGGFPVLDLAVKEVQPNAPAGITLPDNVRTASERVAAEKVADGVWFLGGGSHNSVAIEMSNHIVLVEAPLYDGRTQAVLDEVKRLIPGKPVRTVINSHHHFDHSGGLRTAVADGATLVTSQAAKPYFEKVFANPNTIRPDRLAKSGRQPEILGVVTKRQFIDGDLRFEVHEIQDSVHAQGFLMVYLPKEKLLIEADAYTPSAPNSPPPPVPNGNNVNLAQNIERLGLQVDRILPLHGRVVPIGELYATIGRSRP